MLRWRRRKRRNDLGEARQTDAGRLLGLRALLTRKLLIAGSSLGINSKLF